MSSFVFMSLALKKQMATLAHFHPYPLHLGEAFRFACTLKEKQYCLMNVDNVLALVFKFEGTCFIKKIIKSTVTGNLMIGVKNQPDTEDTFEIIKHLDIGLTVMLMRGLHVIVEGMTPFLFWSHYLERLAFTHIHNEVPIYNFRAVAWGHLRTFLKFDEFEEKNPQEDLLRTHYDHWVIKPNNGN